MHDMADSNCRLWPYLTVQMLGFQQLIQLHQPRDTDVRMGILKLPVYRNDALKPYEVAPSVSLPAAVM